MPIFAFIKGEFGVVYQAKLRRGFDNVCDLVAVKTLRGRSYLAGSERIKLCTFQELNSMLINCTCMPIIVLSKFRTFR